MVDLKSLCAKFILQQRSMLNGVFFFFFQSSGVKLSNINIKNISGTYNSEFAVNLQCSSAVPCENVQLSYINLTAIEPPETDDIGRFNCKGSLNNVSILNSTF